MFPPPSQARGFTLLEVLAALVVLSAILVVGLGGMQVGMRARAEVAQYADLRLLGEAKVAELSGLSRGQLEAVGGELRGRFDPPFADAWWSARIREEEDPSGVPSSLFRLDLEVGRARDRVRVSTYLNRFAGT